MKKVLLPTDFSTNAYNAILYALKLYGNTSCVFYLMHSYMVPIYTSEYNMANPLGMDLLEIYKKQAMDQLTALKEELLLHHKNPKHRFEVHSAFGILTDEIWEFVRKEEIDVVVMGTQGATGAKEVLLGSNTVHLSTLLMKIPSKFYSLRILKWTTKPRELKSYCIWPRNI